MMSCRELAELLHEFLTDELLPEHRQGLEDHLGICPPCYNLLETYRLTISLVRQLPPEGLPCDCEQRLRQALAQHLEQEQA
jgi:hypothetical protein